MLSAITFRSLASSPRTLSAAGHDEHPCDVNNSTTARGSAWAGRTIATMAQTPSAPDHREIKLWVIVWVIIVATLEPGYDTTPGSGSTFKRAKAALHRPPFVHPPLTSQ